MTSTQIDPEHIAISKSKGIEIDWKDGHHSSYGVAYLRDECPCAVCTGRAWNRAPEDELLSSAGFAVSNVQSRSQDG